MAEHIDAIIKIRRGADADRRTIVFDQGEIAYSSDIKRVFIGDGTSVGASLVGNLNTIGASPSPYAINKDLFYNSNTCIMYMLSNESGGDALINYARVTPIADGTSIAYNNGVFSVVDTYITDTINTTVTEIIATTLPIATNSTLGGIKVGTGLSAAVDGTLSLSGLPNGILPIATNSTLGGIKVGTGLSATIDGTLSLSVATSSTLGGVIAGTGLSADDTGKLDVIPSDLNFIPNPEQRNDNEILTFNAINNTWEAKPLPGNGHLIAWCYFDGTKDESVTTSTAISNRLLLVSNGISSVYRAALGQFQINFDPILLSPKYVIICSGSKPGYPLIASPNLNNANGVVTPTVSSCTILFNDNGGSDKDPLYGYVTIFGNNIGNYINLLILFLQHGAGGKDERTIINVKKWTDGVIPNRIHVSITSSQTVLNINGTIVQNTGNNSSKTGDFWITVSPANGGSFYVKCCDNNYGKGVSAFTLLGWD